MTVTDWREAFLRYGTHTELCQATQGGSGKCDCGFSELLRGARVQDVNVEGPEYALTHAGIGRIVSRC